VLKLEGDTWNDSLVPAKLGNSSALEVGSLVVAIGNPLNIGISMSLGIVSAIGRTLEDVLVPLHLIQTDAAINSGNSGGPLVNIDGEVIGINVAKVSDKIAAGIGFAIPVDYAKDIVDTLSRGEKIGNGWIGAEVTRPLSEDRELWQLPQQEGIIVTKIFPASPAEQAGLKRNDYITEVNRKPVLTSRDFKWIIQNTRLQVNLTVWRMGTQIEIAVSVEQEPEQGKQSPMPSGHTHP
jgi:S1-C subfamily serine protease